MMSGGERRNDVLIPLSVLLLGLSTLLGLGAIVDRFVSLEARLVRLEVSVFRIEKSLDRQHPIPPAGPR